VFTPPSGEYGSIMSVGLFAKVLEVQRKRLSMLQYWSCYYAADATNMFGAFAWTLNVSDWLIRSYQGGAHHQLGT
jgi:hypothetical protein